MVREFWEEDSRLESVVNHARSELAPAERTLASIMDKASNSLHTDSNHTQLWSRILRCRAVDRIAERNRLLGVYGPLYCLLTVKNKVYNTAVELSAGARWTPPMFSVGTRSDRIACIRSCSPRA